jgi:hypothetical protein
MLFVDIDNDCTNSASHNIAASPRTAAPMAPIAGSMTLSTPLSVLVLEPLAVAAAEPAAAVALATALPAALVTDPAILVACAISEPAADKAEEYADAASPVRPEVAVLRTEAALESRD